MERCTKCQGTNFIKRGKSNKVETMEYLLCSCGNVMIKDSRISGLIETPEHDDPLTRFMIEDSAQALGFPVSAVAINKEELDKKALSALNSLLLSYASNDCDECYEYYSEDDEYEYDEVDEYDEEQDDEEQDDEDQELLEDFCRMTTKILKSLGDEKLIEKWNSIQHNSLLEMTKEYENLGAMNITELMKMTNQLIDAIPLPISYEKKEDLMAEIIARDFSDSGFSKLIHSFESKKTPSIQFTEEPVSNDNDLKDYVLLEKDGTWEIHRQVSKNEISRIINEENEFEDFLIFEINPLDIKVKSEFVVM